MNLISNCCCGARVYKKCNEQYNNPFMWSLMSAFDFIKLIENYDKINFDKICVVFSDLKIRHKDKVFTKVIIDGTYTVHYIHYLQCDSLPENTVETKLIDVLCSDAKQYTRAKYTSRLKRMSGEPTFLIWGDANKSKFTEDDLEALLKLNSNYKIAVIGSACKNFVDRSTDKLKFIYSTERRYDGAVNKCFDELKTFFLP